MISTGHRDGPARRSAWAGLLSWTIAMVCFLSVSPVSAMADGPDEGGRVVLGFEARSNRLTSTDMASLDRLAVTVGGLADSHLFILVPSPHDPAIRHFIRSRVAVVQQELAKRGLAGEMMKSPRAEADDAIVLWVAPKVLPTTPLEIEPIAATVSMPVQVLPEEPKPELHPTPLLPPGSVDEKLEADNGGPPRSSFSSAPASASPPPRSEEGPIPSPILPAAAANAEVDEVWTAPVGHSLRTVLMEWGGRSGWTVVWQSDREYPIDASATFSGDFTKAASQLFEGFSTAVPVPSAHFYKGNRVLLVESGEGR